MADAEKKPPGPKKGVAVKRPRLVIPAGLSPIYSNVVRIAHTPSEMVFDFGQILPGDSQAPIKARILMTPLSAKLLHRALSENLTKFEAAFGEIKMPQGKSLADNLFGSLNNPENPDDPPKDE